MLPVPRSPDCACGWWAGGTRPDEVWGSGCVSARRSCQLLVAPSRAPRSPLVPLFHSPQSPQVKGRKAGWVLAMRVAEGSYFTGQSPQNSVRLFWQHGAAIKGMWNSDVGSNSSPAGNPATQAAWSLVPRPVQQRCQEGSLGVLTGTTTRRTLTHRAGEEVSAQ